MPKRSNLAKLDDERQQELDARIRDAGYGDYIAIAVWLQAQGIHASKSAVHRYGAELKARDKAVDSLAGAIGMDDRGKEKSAIELLLELGAIRVRERAILMQLESIGVSGRNGTPEVTSSRAGVK